MTRHSWKDIQLKHAEGTTGTSNEYISTDEPISRETYKQKLDRLWHSYKYKFKEGSEATTLLLQAFETLRKEGIEKAKFNRDALFVVTQATGKGKKRIKSNNEKHRMKKKDKKSPL